MRRLPRCRDRDCPGTQEAVAEYRSRASRMRSLGYKPRKVAPTTDLEAVALIPRPLGIGGLGQRA
jgi:hypothetical protein